MSSINYEKYLEKDECILWRGRPEKGIYTLRKHIALYISCAVGFLSFIVSLIILCMSSYSKNGIDISTGVIRSVLVIALPIFVAFTVLYLVFVAKINIIISDNPEYIITNLNVIEVRKTITGKFVINKIKGHNIDDISVQLHRNDTATIVFMRPLVALYPLIPIFSLGLVREETPIIKFNSIKCVKDYSGACKMLTELKNQSKAK